MIIITKNIKETAQVAAKLIHFIQKKAKQTKTKENNKALIITLKGDLGSGKTAFVKEFARQIGISIEVLSPTFVIEKLYSIPSGRLGYFKKMIHIDAYRLEKGEELQKIGWKNIENDPSNIIFIEWPENVVSLFQKIQKSQKVQKKTEKSSAMDAMDINLSFEFIDENTRKITIPDEISPAITLPDTIDTIEQ